MNLNPDWVAYSLNLCLTVTALWVIMLALGSVIALLQPVENFRSKIRKNYAVYLPIRYYSFLLTSIPGSLVILIYSLLRIPVAYVFVVILSINATTQQLFIVTAVISFIITILVSPKILRFFFKPEYLIYGNNLIIRYAGVYFLIPFASLSNFYKDTARKRIGFKFKRKIFFFINHSYQLYFEFDQEVEQQNMLEEIEKRLSITIEEKELIKRRERNNLKQFQAIRKIDVQKGSEQLPEKIIKIITLVI